MELFWVKEAQIQGNMSSSLSTGFEITDTGLHYMQNARHADSLSTIRMKVCLKKRQKSLFILMFHSGPT